MHAIEIIQKKRDKCSLNKQEIGYLVNKYVEGLIPDYQMAAFLMATCINGMQDEEISWLTDAMLYSGEIIEHKRNGSFLVDKHSTGGVGDKISIPLAPAVAACGLKVPMIAGRGLGHTGGTLDKLESIPGFNCNLTSLQYKAQVAEIGCVIMGQTNEIAPADKKLYALRDVTGTVESIPLISSSIMSKKLAEGIDGLVLDVKFGSGAFMKEIGKARLLASTMVAIGMHMGKKVTARLTNMDQPLGNMIGNSLEIIESIEILQGRGPEDSVALTVELGAEMLLLGNLAQNLEEGRALIEQSFRSGQAFTKFVEMVKAQGGDERVIHEPEKFCRAKRQITIEAKCEGYVKSMNNQAIGWAVGVLGGGRCQITDPINHYVGIEMHAKIGDRIEKGQPICTLFAEDKGIEEATNRIEHAVEIVPEAVIKPELCKDRITSI
jgi:pyrimidine-nucleoside phosphorylase